MTDDRVRKTSDGFRKTLYWTGVYGLFSRGDRTITIIMRMLYMIFIIACTVHICRVSRLLSVLKPQSLYYFSRDLPSTSLRRFSFPKEEMRVIITDDSFFFLFMTHEIFAFVYENGPWPKKS